MAKRGVVKKSTCPVFRTLDEVGDRWSLLIVRDAFDGVRRFGEFQQNLGVSRGILASRLHDLVARGILETIPASDGSAYREYVLTEKGRGLFPVVVALRQWGEDHCFTPGERHSTLVDNKSESPVARLEVRSKTGHVLKSTDTNVKKVEGL